MESLADAATRDRARITPWSIILPVLWRTAVDIRPGRKEYLTGGGAAIAIRERNSNGRDLNSGGRYEAASALPSRDIDIGVRQATIFRDGNGRYSDSNGGCSGIKSRDNLSPGAG